MGKRADRKAFKKNGVDAAMAVATDAGDGGGGWAYGDQIASAMTEDGKDGAALGSAAAAAGGGVGGKKAPRAGGALTAGGVRAKRKTATVLLGIIKRKKKAVAKGIAFADRKANKLKKNTARRGIREEGKTLY